MANDLLIRIVSPWFVAGVVVGKKAAPIVGYMVGWRVNRILAYAKRRGWTAEIYWRGRYTIKKEEQ